MNSVLAVIAFTCFVGSFFGVALIRRWAPRNLLDLPNERSSHSVPTPSGGGLAVAIVLFTGLGVLQAIVPLWPTNRFVVFVAASGLVAAVSWIDDLRTVANRWRFLVHIIAAVSIVWAFGPWERLEVGSLSLRSAGAGWMLTVVWIVGLINAFNFMDGIDGIAGLQALIAAGAWFVLAPDLATRAVAIVLAASTAGFLLHNWPPARIFMGDVGSALLGFVLASIPLLSAAENRVFDYSAFFVLWPFIFDATFTILRRWRRGENVFRAHRSHLYQRLVICGLSHRAVTAIYGVLAAGGALLAREVAEHRMSERVAFLSVSLMAVALWGLTATCERSLHRS